MSTVQFHVQLSTHLHIFKRLVLCSCLFPCQRHYEEFHGNFTVYILVLCMLISQTISTTGNVAVIANFNGCCPCLREKSWNDEVGLEWRFFRNTKFIVDFYRFIGYYLRNKKVSIYNISSFIDMKINRNQLRIHEYLMIASFDWITATIHQRSSLQSFPKYSGVMAFQTFLGIFLIFSFATFKFIAPKRFNKS